MANERMNELLNKALAAKQNVLQARQNIDTSQLTAGRLMSLQVL